MRLLRCVAACAGVMLLAGCGPGNPLGRLPVSGTVTFQGKPLDQGTIEFAPEDGRGVASGAVIKDGRYSIPELKGLPPGTYRVRISSAEPSSTGPPPEFPGEHKTEAKERIPAAFNTQSTQTVKVTAGGTNQFDFQIP